MRYFFILTSFVLSINLSTVTRLHAQHYDISFIGKNNLHKANTLYRKKRYEEALTLYNRYLSDRKPSVRTALNVADCLKHLYKTQEAEKWYKYAWANDSSAIAKSYFLDFAEVLLMNGKNQEALHMTKRYLQSVPDDEKEKALLKSIEQYADFYRDSLQYSIHPYFVNSSFAEFAPSLYRKGELVFCSSRPQEGIIQYAQASNSEPLTHLYTASPEDRQVSAFLAFRKASHHDGPVTFWDNATQAIYSSNETEWMGTHPLVLWYIRYDNKVHEWSKPQRLPFQKSDISYSHPYFDESQQILYFASNAPNGMGGTDLYKTKYTQGQWEQPENLGNLVNTSGNEMYPFHGKDGMLYFTSDGHTGMGGQDLYVFKTDSNSQQVINLGYPINSPFDDFSLILADSSNKGWFSSNRSGNDDIYEVEIYRTDLTLTVKDPLNFHPLSQCLIKTVEEESGHVRQLTYTDKYGKAHCSLIPGKNYILKVYQNGYKMQNVPFIEQERESKHASLTVKLHRANQRYVKVKVLHLDNPVASCPIKLIDFSSDSILTYQTNEQGVLLCPINADTTTLMYFQHGTMQGQLLFDKDLEGKESSGITYCTVALSDTIIEQKIKGRVLTTEGAPIVNQTFYIHNLINQDHYSIITNEQGEFEALMNPLGRFCLSKDVDKQECKAQRIPTQNTVWTITWSE